VVLKYGPRWSPTEGWASYAEHTERVAIAALAFKIRFRRSFADAALFRISTTASRLRPATMSAPCGRTGTGGSSMSRTPACWSVYRTCCTGSAGGEPPIPMEAWCSVIAA
jgi:hypothetical protein